MQPHRPLPGEIGRTLGAYVTGTAKVSLILSLLYMVGFAISGVPWWPLVGLLCGLFNIVPIFGALAALVFAGFVSMFSHQEGSWIGVLVTFVIVQGLEGFVITPRVLGRSLRTPPLVLFVAILIGGLFFNIAGALLAAPLAAIGYLIWKRRNPSIQGR